jgi:hypothetical protein
LIGFYTIFNYYQFSIGIPPEDLYDSTVELIGDGRVSFGNEIFLDSVTCCIEESVSDGSYRFFNLGYRYDAERCLDTPFLVFQGVDFTKGLAMLVDSFKSQLKIIPDNILSQLSSALQDGMKLYRDNNSSYSGDSMDIENISSSGNDFCWAPRPNYGEIEIDDVESFSGALFIEIIPRYNRSSDIFDSLGSAIAYDEQACEGDNVMVGYFIPVID